MIYLLFIIMNIEKIIILLFISRYISSFIFQFSHFITMAKQLRNKIMIIYYLWDAHNVFFLGIK